MEESIEELKAQKQKIKKDTDEQVSTVGWLNDLY